MFWIYKLKKTTWWIKNKTDFQGLSQKNYFLYFWKINQLDNPKKVEKKTVQRSILSFPYDPRLPNVSNILYRFWPVMTRNPCLKSIFSNLPMVRNLLYTNLYFAMIPFEQVRSKDPFVIKAREHKYIQLFDSYRRGLTQEP